MKIAELFDPLLIGLAALIAGLILWQRAAPKGAGRRPRALAWAALTFLYLASCPLLANGILRLWQPLPVDLAPLLRDTPVDHRALVVLASGKRNTLDFVPSVEQLGGDTQGRLVGAARIYAEQGFGVVVVTATGEPFANAMADFLVQLGVPRDRIVKEIHATDTRENATNVAAILAERQPERVVLVTSALHMRRALIQFRRAGVDAIPAPVDYQGGRTWKILPSSSALTRNKAVLHEVLGLLEP